MVPWLAAYRDLIAEADHKIALLTTCLAALRHRLTDSASRMLDQRTAMTDGTTIPAELPVSEYDGAAE